MFGESTDDKCAGTLTATGRGKGLLRTELGNQIAAGCVENTVANGGCRPDEQNVVLFVDGVGRVGRLFRFAGGENRSGYR